MTGDEDEFAANSRAPPLSAATAAASWASPLTTFLVLNLEHVDPKKQLEIYCMSAHITLKLVGSYCAP